MKLLIHREKREVVDGREFIVAKAKQYIVSDTTKDFSTTYGSIAKKDLKAKPGSIVKTKTGKEFVVLDADWLDIYKRLRRLAQTIPLKDLGAIIAETGIDKSSICVDAGLGSGALACFLAHLAKHVTSYEIREDCIATAKQNMDNLGIKNLTIKHKDVCEGIDEKEVDLITLDLPEPWKAISHAAKALRVGGWLVCYTPQITQAQEAVSTITKDKRLLYSKTLELIERQWKIEGRIVRPKNTPIGHSGFLTFARRIQ